MVWENVEKKLLINRCEKPNVSSSRSENSVFRAAFVKQNLKTLNSRRIKCPRSPRKNRWACCESAFCLVNILASASLDF